MPQKLRILIVDDSNGFPELLKASLPATEFSIEVVKDSEKALQRLNECFYHTIFLQDGLGLAVLDQLEEENRLTISNFFICQQRHDQDTIKEMYSHYRYRDDKFVFKILTRSKEFYARIIRNEVGNIRLDIEIEYPEGQTASEIVDRLEIEKPFASEADRQEHIEEFELLLCDLLREYSRVSLKVLTPGYSGAGVLLVDGYMGEKQAAFRLMKFGQYAPIYEEHENFKKYVENFFGMMCNVFRFSVTTHFAGILYTFLGKESGEPLHEFGAQYQHIEDADSIVAILDQLLNVTCYHWYRNRIQPQKARDLAEYYRRTLKLSTDTLKPFIDKLPTITLNDRQIMFDRLPTEDSFINPLVALEVSYPCNYFVCDSHGDLNERNILLNTAGTAWLIDFEHTGVGHILRDIASLDTAIRISILKTHEADFEERYAFERALLSIERFDNPSELMHLCPSSNPVIRKTFQVILHLRRLAQQKVAPTTEDNKLQEYYVALFHFTLRALKFRSSLSDLQREHALLSASLLAHEMPIPSP